MNRRVAAETYSRLLAKRREQGFSLVEILVVVGLLAVVGVVITAAILNTTEANDNVGAATMTQRELLDTTSAVSRDISTSTEIVAAGDYHLVMKVNSDGGTQTVGYFYHSPEDGKEVAPAVTELMETYEIKESELPSFPAVMEFRENKEGGNVLRTLVPGYLEQDGKPLFRFYDVKNNSFDNSNHDTEGNLKEKYFENGGAATGEIDGAVKEGYTNSIERIEMRFAAKPMGRDNALELATSVTPKTEFSVANGGQQTYANIPTLSKPVLTATLAPRTQVANLSWTRVEGATGYTLYRDNRTQDIRPKVVATFDRNTVSTTDANLIWGETYTYYIVASGPSGLSEQSNVAEVTVVPPKPVITGSVNDRTNTITWQHVNGVGPKSPVTGGAGTGYRLYRIGDDGKVTEFNVGHNTSYTDTGRNFGDLNSYYLVAYNRGGDSFDSEKIDLITRPPATTVAVDIPEKSQIASVSWAPAKRADTYTVYRENRKDSSVVKVITTRETSTASANLTLGEKYTYYVTSQNSGGTSNQSNKASDWVVPPAPTLTGKASGSTNTLSWKEVNGVGALAETADQASTGYRLYRVVGGNATKIYEGRNLTYADTGRANGAVTDYYVEPFNLGGTGFVSNTVRLVSPPVAPKVTVKDFDDKRDGSNIINWTKPANTTQFNFQKNNGNVTNVKTEQERLDPSPGADTSHSYKVQACNSAGCSPWGSATGKQPPGDFRLSGLVQNRSDWSYVYMGDPDSAKQWNGDFYLNIAWHHASGADSYAIKDAANTGINRSGIATDSRSVRDTNRIDNTVYTYRIGANGATSGLTRNKEFKIQTAPAMPREARGWWMYSGGAKGSVYATFKLQNSAPGVGRGGNGYGVQSNPAIFKGSGTWASGAELVSRKGWAGWKEGTTRDSAKWNMRESGKGLGAMLMYRAKTNQQSGAHLAGVANTTSWKSFSAAEGNYSELMAFSMRTYGSGGFGNTGQVKQNRPWGYYQNTASMNDYYRIINGG